MKPKTYAFDNQRVFVKRSQGGEESDFDGWAKITAKGRREFLPGIDSERCALIVIDRSKHDHSAWPDQISQCDRSLGDVLRQRTRDVVVPNVACLLDLFHKHGMWVVYFTLAKDDVLPEIAPIEGEILLSKFSSGAFATSPLDLVLCEHGIATLFFVGAATNGCVDHTMSSAYDRSYQVTLVEDGCRGSRPDLHEAAVKIWAHKGFVPTTDQVVNDYPWDCWVDPTVKDPQVTRVESGWPRRCTANQNNEAGIPIPARQSWAPTQAAAPWSRPAARTGPTGWAATILRWNGSRRTYLIDWGEETDFDVPLSDGPTPLKCTLPNSTRANPSCRSPHFRDSSTASRTMDSAARLEFHVSTGERIVPMLQGNSW